MQFSESEAIGLQMHGQDVPSLLAHWAEHKPNHPALVWAPAQGPARRWTYEELLRDVLRVAGGLSKRGIAIGDRVLIHSENSPEMVLAWLACATVGAVAVTTNTKSTAAELRYFAERIGAVAAITQPQFADLVETAAPALKWMAVTGDERGNDFASLLAEPESWRRRPPDPMLPMGIMFTSGTTSRPKPVVHTHANAIWASRVGPRNIDLATGDVYLIYLPLFHTNAQTWSFFPVLGVGGTAVLMPKWSQSRFWSVVLEHGVTHTSVMPFTMAALGDADRPGQHPLRVGVFGLIVPELSKQFGVDLYAAYGMTETVSHAISARPADQPTPRSMGRVNPGYEIAIVDPATGALCRDGDNGELWLRGTRGIQLFLEYFDDEDANAAAFQDGWFKTGDIVRMGADGSVFYVERDKDVLKVGGENVSAREVEELVGAIPGVRAVAVVGKHHAFLDQVPVAFVVRSPDADEATLAGEILSRCEEQLASFKVPRAVYYLDELPTGAMDKLLKNRLREAADAEPSLD